jgi:hypothetical protein
MVINLMYLGNCLYGFDSGDEYKPEFISADHYNVNLERN